jgi:hypothetical protein
MRQQNNEAGKKTSNHTTMASQHKDTDKMDNIGEKHVRRSISLRFIRHSGK